MQRKSILATPQPATKAAKKPLQKSKLKSGITKKIPPLTKPRAKTPVSSSPKKKISFFRAKIRSRHGTHKPLGKSLPLLPFRAVVRLGSFTNLPDDTAHGGSRIECNTVAAIATSANKKKMKVAFDAGNVKTAAWCQGSTATDILSGLKMKEFSPIVSKSLTGSRGRGNMLHTTMVSLQNFMNSHAGNLSNYIFERYHNYVREYRLHVTKAGCFYTCRKMLKESTPDDKRWYRNDSNCTWIVESNPQFDKPVNWDNIVSECVKALVAVGLDVGACDVKVQSSKDGKGNLIKSPEFIVIEINSAPSFGDITLQKYVEVIPKILKTKYVESHQ